MIDLPSDCFEYIDCPVCGSDKHAVFYQGCYGDFKPKTTVDYTHIGLNKRSRLSYVQCKHCGLVFSNPRVKLEYQSLVYNECKAAKYRDGGYEINEAFLVRERHKKIAKIQTLARVLEHVDVTRPLTMLDYGSGFGHSMSVGRALTIDAYGVDVDAYRVRMGVDQGLKVCLRDEFDQKYPDVIVDIVLVEDVIEHVVDLNRELSFIRGHCREGAVLYVNSFSQWAMRRNRALQNFQQSSFIEHLNYFPVATLDRLFRKHNFEPIGFRSSGMLQPIRKVKLWLKLCVVEKSPYLGFCRMRSNYARLYRATVV